MPKPGHVTNNASITSFFKKVVEPRADDKTQSQASQRPGPSSPLRAPSPVPFSSPLSYRFSPRKPTSNRDAVIAASDEEEDDDGSSADDGLEDLMAKFDPKRNATSIISKTSDGVLVTPKAKRTMRTTFDSSPLTPQPRHTFDMSALAKDALQDEATHASSLRNKETAEEPSVNRQRDNPDAFVDIVQNKTGADAQKVMRAVERSKTGQAKPRYCFFTQSYTPPPAPKDPKIAKNSPWRPLVEGTLSTREQYLTSGLPQTFLKKIGELPEGIFLWILDDIATQNSRSVQLEYCNLISRCPNLIRTQVTPSRLEDIFSRLGAHEPSEKTPLFVQDDDIYKERGWACLRSFITLLGLISHDLPPGSVDYALQALIKMSMDKFLLCNMDILAVYEETIQRLLDAQDIDAWDLFCHEIAQLLRKCLTSQATRISGLLCLPIGHKKAHNLRRRLATAFLFDDPELARQNTDTVITLRSIINRLNGPDFAVTGKIDFDELRASVLLLNIVVDDGSFMVSDDLEDEKTFNSEVDELVSKLREIWRKINDAGMKLSRTETKSVIEWVQQRITHTVRTRKKAKKSVFDTIKREDTSLPQQQNYMRMFLGKSVDTKEENDR